MVKIQSTEPLQVGFFKEPRFGVSHMKKTKKNKKQQNWCLRPGVSCPVPVFSRHDRRANSTLSALQLEVRKIPFPICFLFRRGSFLLFLFNFLY